MAVPRRRDDLELRVRSLQVGQRWRRYPPARRTVHLAAPVHEVWDQIRTVGQGPRTRVVPRNKVRVGGRGVVSPRPFVGAWVREIWIGPFRPARTHRTVIFEYPQTALKVPNDNLQIAVAIDISNRSAAQDSGVRRRYLAGRIRGASVRGQRR